MPFNIGAPELLIVLVVVLIVFGAGRLPAVMGDLGRGMREFKRAQDEPPATPMTPMTPMKPTTSSVLTTPAPAPGAPMAPVPPGTSGTTSTTSTTGMPLAHDVERARA